MENDKRKIEFRCEHKHNGYEHPACFRRHFFENEKIGFLDIETEDLNAEYGIIFGYCLKGLGEPKIHEGWINLKDINLFRSKNRDVEPKEDTNVVRKLITDMGKFKRLVGHYSSLFDLPFIRTRAVICGLPFPEFGEFYQTDTWQILRKKFKLRRNTLENSCRKLLGVSNKDHLSLSIKHGVLRGEAWAIEATREHCRKDVLDTEALYKKIYGYAKVNRSSI